MKRGRPVYCKDPADWERIKARADPVGTSVSEFVMTCALQDTTPAPYTPLILTPEEQRDLVRHFRTVQKRLVELFHSREDGGLSLESAIQVLYRLHNDNLPVDDQFPE